MLHCGVDLGARSCGGDVVIMEQDEKLILTDALQNVVTEITELLRQLTKVKLAPYFRLGELLTEVNEAPDKYLTEKQLVSYPKPSLLLSSLFVQEYGSSCAEYFLGAESFYKRVFSLENHIDGHR